MEEALDTPELVNSVRKGKEKTSVISINKRLVFDDMTQRATSPEVEEGTTKRIKQKELSGQRLFCLHLGTQELSSSFFEAHRHGRCIV